MAATTKSIPELVDDADTLATSFEYVLYSGHLYTPMDYETEDHSVVPPVDRKCWKPMAIDDVQEKARTQFNTAFVGNQLRDFTGLVRQAAFKVRTPQSWLLVKTANGLKVLHGDGKLHDPDGRFVPNMLVPVLNEDPDDKAELMSVITEWLGGLEEEALSLLRHLATALAPHWSAGKYVLLIGDGRNGKSVLMYMLRDLFGQHNCSDVVRQVMAARDGAAFDLNGKLLNLVFDGPAEFVKDSGTEKTLITGEPIGIRKLYAQEQSVIQTNALFMEGLNKEPKTSDKSAALQARLVRFWFPNKYAEDLGFAAHMRSERMVGALLSLLIDNYVLPENKALMLAPTEQSRQLQLEHMVDNSMALQFILHLEETDPLGAEAILVDQPFDQVVSRFQSWRVKVNDLTVFDQARLLGMFGPVLHLRRKSARIAGKTSPIKVHHITGFKQDTLDLLASVKEEDHVSTPMVED